MEFSIGAVWSQLVNFLIGKEKAMCSFESFNLAFEESLQWLWECLMNYVQSICKQSRCIHKTSAHSSNICWEFYWLTLGKPIRFIMQTNTCIAAFKNSCCVSLIKYNYCPFLKWMWSFTIFIKCISHTCVWVKPHFLGLKLIFLHFWFKTWKLLRSMELFLKVNVMFQGCK